MKGPYSFVPFGCGLRVNSTRGEILAVEDLQVRKRLVVLELLVEPRLDVLDEPGFQQQGVDLAVGFQHIDVGDFWDEVGGAAVELGGAVEVAADPAAQVDRLADVDHARC